MTHEAPTTPTHGRWIVEFTDFRIRNDKQRRAIESFSRPLLDEVLKIWLKVVTPGAHTVEPHSATPWTIIFPNALEERETFGANQHWCSGPAPDRLALHSERSGR
jgi:hypothetical protein